MLPRYLFMRPVLVSWYSRPNSLFRAEFHLELYSRCVELFLEFTEEQSLSNTHGTAHAGYSVVRRCKDSCRCQSGRLCARCHPTATGGAKISFQFDTLVISKAANPHSHKPEGIMWRQPRLIRRNATGFTESANSWIAAQPERILRPNVQTVLWYSAGCR